MTERERRVFISGRSFEVKRKWGYDSLAGLAVFYNYCVLA
jgi:hypothetical protein